MRRNRRQLGCSRAHGFRIMPLLTISIALAFMEAGAAEPFIVRGQAEQGPPPADSLASRADSPASPADSLASRLAIPTQWVRKGRLPLAPSKGYERPRFHPSVNFGLGMRTFHPDLSGFAELLGRTPSIDLSPVTSVFVEFNFSDLVSLQVDGGTIRGSTATNGHHGLLGLVAYPRVFPDPRLRPSIGAGLSFCHFHTHHSGFLVYAGAQGWYATVGLEYRAHGPAVQIYAGYSSVGPISTTVQGESIEEPARVSMNLSSVMLGIRLKV